MSAVAADIVAIITDEVKATAAERIEGLQQKLGELFNTDLTERWRRGAHAAALLFRIQGCVRPAGAGRTGSLMTGRA